MKGNIVSISQTLEYSYNLFSLGRDPDSRPPTNFLQKIMNGVHVTYQWTETPEALVDPPYESNNQELNDGCPVYFQICIHFSCPLDTSGCQYDCA